MFDKLAKDMFVGSHKTEEKKSPLRSAIAGGLSGAVATAATLPLETLQIAESVNANSKKDIIKNLYNEGKDVFKVVKDSNGVETSVKKAHPIIDAIAKHLKLEKVLSATENVNGIQRYKGIGGKIRGVGRFYKGLDTKLFKVVPTMALTFPVYKYVEDKLKEHKFGDS